MNIIIPLGGLGERFKKNGYNKPKPLIKLLGKEMLFHVIDNLNISSDDNLFIIYNNNLDFHNFSDIIESKYKNIKLIKLLKNTQGAVETILYGLQQIDKLNLTKKTLLLDCDTFYYIDIVSIFKKSENNLLFCFEDMEDKPIYSYIKIDNNGYINEIKEKEKISKYANTGCYCFMDAIILKKYCEKVIDNNIKFNSEFYTSCAISEMIKDNIKFEINLLTKNNFKCVGTPYELQTFCYNNNINEQKMRICFDLDGTLVTFPKINGDYTSVLPITKNINYLNFLKTQGHTIIIYTARRMRTHSGNIGKVINDVGKITLDTLSKFGILYDEFYFGKPYANIYIDDLAANVYCDLEKEIGIYKHISEYNKYIPERDFNKISSSTMKIITKKSEKKIILGEIHFYKNIPEIIKNYFPLFINNGKDWYSIEEIEGITISSLYVNELMTVDILNKYLLTIKKIHESQICDESTLNIYENYSNKIKSRFANYNYSKFNNSKNIYDKLINYFNNYEKNNMGMIGVIHGDPIFTNCIKDLNDEFKFIDMRGCQGNKLTIYGDVLYDYGKIYQSIIGYDEILLDTYVNLNFKNLMINAFESFICSTYGKDNMDKIKMITKSLLFTLIPHHTDQIKCKKYYDLIKKI